MRRVLSAAIVVVGLASISWYLFGRNDVSPDPLPFAEKSSSPNIYREVQDVSRQVAAHPSSAEASRLVPDRAPGFIGWNKLTLSDPLRDVMRRAATTRNPDEAYSAVQMEMVCGTSEHLKESDLEGMVSVLAPKATSALKVTTQQSMNAAREKLIKYCESHGEREHALALAQARQTFLTGTSITKILAQLPLRTGDGRLPPLSQEQAQAAILALSQPGSYPMAVERLLAGPAIGLPDYWALQDDQRTLARSLIYWELTGDRSPDSVRNVFTCLTAAVCLASSDGLSASAEITKVTKQVVGLIQSQNWVALGIQR